MSEATEKFKPLLGARKPWYPRASYQVQKYRVRFILSVLDIHSGLQCLFAIRAKFASFLAVPDAFEPSFKSA